MTIQLSVLLWTMINFAVLMLLLDRILFRPYHAVMDQRAGRLQSAVDLNRSNALKLQIGNERFSTEQARIEDEALSKYKAAVEQAAKDADAKLREAKINQKKELDQYKLQLQEEKSNMLDELQADFDDLAVKVADRLSA